MDLPSQREIRSVLSKVKLSLWRGSKLRKLRGKPGVRFLIIVGANGFTYLVGDKAVIPTGNYCFAEVMLYRNSNLDELSAQLSYALAADSLNLEAATMKPIDNELVSNCCVEFYRFSQFSS